LLTIIQVLGLKRRRLVSPKSCKYWKRRAKDPIIPPSSGRWYRNVWTGLGHATNAGING
jgi:hypothetical protein